MNPQLQNLRICFNIPSCKPVFQVLHSLQVSLPKACKHISVPCLLHVHNIINLLLFYEGYKSWSSRLCCFLRPAVTSSRLDTLYSWLFDKICSLTCALSETYWPCVNTLQRFRILSFNEKIVILNKQSAVRCNVLSNFGYTVVRLNMPVLQCDGTMINKSCVFRT
jgi:hypothetical protein